MFGDNSGSWTPSAVKRFVLGRSGDGGVWSLHGGLIALGNGRRLADIVGVEEYVISQEFAAHSRDDVRLSLAASDPEEPPADLTHSAELVSRTSLFYVEPGSRRRMRSFRFRPTTRARTVDPVAPPPTSLSVSLDSVGALTLQRGLARVRVPFSTNHPHLQAAWAYVGRLASKKNAPSRPSVVETYDYSVNRGASSLAWSRVGKCPSWYGSGQCLTYLHGSRVRGGWRSLDVAVKGWLAEIGRKSPLTVAALDNNL